MRTVFPVRISAAAWVLVLVTHGACRAQSGITEEGAWTVFRTGGDEPLVTLGMPLQIPSSDSSPSLRLVFGFATSEADTPGAFLDSFSVTLQREDGTATALALTADRAGVQWAPPTPGGVVLDPTNLVRTAFPFPELAPVHAIQFAFSVLLPVPMGLTGSAATLFLDLFDNLNEFASLGFVGGVELETATPQPTLVILESSASADGPYAEERRVELDPGQRTLNLPLFAPARFFQLQSDIRTRLRSMRIQGPETVIYYEFVPETLVLETALLVGGPYTPETNVVVDVSAQVITVTEESVARFYRLRTDGEARLVSVNSTGGAVTLRYEFRPQRLSLLSAAKASGPFAVESGVAVDEESRILRLPRAGRARFFRLRADASIRITGQEISNDQLQLHFESL